MMLDAAPGPRDTRQLARRPHQTVASRAFVVRYAQARQDAVGEEHEPAAGSQQPRGLPDPPRRFAPWARAVLADDDVREAVAEGHALGVRLEQRERGPDRALAPTRSRQLRPTQIDGNHPRARAREPCRQVRGAAPELDD